MTIQFWNSVCAFFFVDAKFWIESPNDKKSCMFLTSRGLHTMPGCNGLLNVVCVKDAKSLCNQNFYISRRVFCFISIFFFLLKATNLYDILYVIKNSQIKEQTCDDLGGIWLIYKCKNVLIVFANIYIQLFNHIKIVNLENEIFIVSNC